MINIPIPLLMYIKENPEIIEKQDVNKYESQTDRILSLIDEYTLKNFVKKELKKNKLFKEDFLREFHNKSQVSKKYYLRELDLIFNKGKDRLFDMHGYYNLDYIGSDLLKFMDESICKIISIGDDDAACEILNNLIKRIEDDMYMNYDPWNDIAYKYYELSEILVENDNLNEDNRYETEKIREKLEDYL